MSNVIWVGTDSGNEGDWDTAANWTVSGGSPAVPVTGDDVYFVSGSQDVTDGFDQSAVALTSLNFGTKYTGNVNASSLEIDVTTLDYASVVGALAIKGTLTTVNVLTTSIDSPALELDECTIGTLRVTGGKGTVLLSGAGEVSGETNMIGCKSVRIEVESTFDVTGSDVTIDDGRLVVYSPTNSMTQYGGVFEFVAATGTQNSITIYDGVCRYKPTEATTLSTLLMYGGFFDMRGCIAPSHTITNATLYSGAYIDERNGLNNAVYTNSISLGGIIKCDLGRSVTVT